MIGKSDVWVGANTEEDNAQMVDLTFGPDGLLPVVAQDAAGGGVLMVAYMNRAALERTLRTGDAWYWSRSRGTLWRKGETSGHTQQVEQVLVDCDGDALLLRVRQQGPACHTGQRSCFFRGLDGRPAEPAQASPSGEAADPVHASASREAADSELGPDRVTSVLPSGARCGGDILTTLFEVIRQRRAAPPTGSYTASLFEAGRERIAIKVREEAEELTRAAQEESDGRVAEEAADLLYHTWVLLAERGIDLDAVRGVLEERRGR